MFNHILVPLDSSKLAECVLPHLVSLAQAFSARCTLLRVVDSPACEDKDRAFDIFDRYMQRSEAEAYLMSLVKQLQAAYLVIECEVMEGLPAQCITEFAHKHNVDLIILSSHGKGGLSPWNVSSITQKVIQSAGTSSIIIRAYQPPVPYMTGFRYQNILVPLDGSLRAECVLPTATKLAIFHQARLILVHFIQKPDSFRNIFLTNEDIELIELFTDRSRQAARKYFEHLQSRLSNDFQELILVCDDVAFSLHEIVESRDIDLVIFSAHGCSGKSKWPFGNITSNFIQYGTIPMLIVQDLSRTEFEPTRAELSVRERSGH